MPGIIVIDASDLERVAQRISGAAILLPMDIEMALTSAVRERLRLIRKAAPSQERTRIEKDSRHPIKLKESFRSIKSVGKRVIVTDAPYKYTWVTEGTKPPTTGGVVGRIVPRFRQALFWPGIVGGRPVARVNKHPGITKPNKFVDRAMLEYGDNDLKIIIRATDRAVMRISNRPTAGAIATGVD